MEVSARQEEKTVGPRDVTELPRVTEARWMHMLKAPPPMYVTESGTATEVRPVPANAMRPMRVTEDGIVTEVTRCAHSQ